MAERDGFVKVAALDELQAAGSMVVPAGGYPVLLLWDEGTVRAVDNRCPHMGYPLSKGTTCDGIIRCHWHHWRFDLESGGCVTGGAYDLPVFPVEVRDGAVWVKPVLPQTSPAERAAAGRDRLLQGLQERDTYVIAKAVADLDTAGVGAREMIGLGARQGVAFRQEGFGPGLTILTALGRLSPLVEGEDRVLLLVHGLSQVSRDSFARAPRRPQRPLLAAQPPDLSRLKRWYREFIDDREEAGAERILRTAIAAGYPLSQVAELLVDGCTDHWFLDTGHVLDFTNKALELVDLIGPEHTAEVLSSLAWPTARARRHEEDSDWSEVARDLALAIAHLPEAQAQGQGAGQAWPAAAADNLLELMLESREPGRIIGAIVAAVAAGARVTDLTRTLVQAGIYRVARYPERNEEDWDAVLHVMTYHNALDQLALRIGGRSASADLALWRGVLHGAVYVYLNHFLNIPRAKLPAEHPRGYTGDRGQAALLERLLHCAEYRQVEEAGLVVHAYLQAGHPLRPLQQALIKAVLREDAAFHTYQMLEAGLTAHERLAPHPDADLALIATARYVSAQRGRRITLSNTLHALKLRRGESPEEE